MAITGRFQSVMTGSPETRIEALRWLLGYPLHQKDPSGSRFWYLRPGEDEDEAEFTCPIAVGFYAELDVFSKDELLKFLTSEAQQTEIYGHYINRVIPDQPVMYLLLPKADGQGRVAMILPTETKLRQRQIQIFDWDAEDLQARLGRLSQRELVRTNRMQESVLSVVPLVEWAFYQPIKTAKELAQQLAEVSRKIEQAIPVVYAAEGNDGYLHTLLLSFQRELLPTLQLEAKTKKDYSFADIYAQTIAYGLFTARVFSFTNDERRQADADARKETDFNRETAWESLPKTNPFLRRLFRDVSQQPIKGLGDALGDAIAEVFSILRAAKMEAILADFRSKMNREDIVIRFYEDFLAAYNPEMREKRGVYYTPEPVVSYMVRSVDILLKEKFDKPLGLADPEVMILDPACGTGTFLLWIFQLIHRRFEENPEALTKGLEDRSWSGYVKERLLPRIFGFELLMAPYAIAHLKLGLFLEETGYQFDTSQRLGIYLINSLEDIRLRDEDQQLALDIPEMERLISEEARSGSRVKKNEPVMVVVGNPPYSGHSENKNKWISALISDYYYVDNQPLEERNPKWLQDDYVKFIRFGQWRIDRSNKGILSFITNHGFLDNPTFRGMRQNLLNSFDVLYNYNLHGNSKKQEKQPNGLPDINVFDIQTGVNICFAIKGVKEGVFHSHLWGDRKTKYKLLSEQTLEVTPWDTANPKKPFYLFTPQDEDIQAEYQLAWKLTDIMPVNVLGFQTHRDRFAIDLEYETLVKRIAEMRDVRISDNDFATKYKLKDNHDWKLVEARKTLRLDNEWKKKIVSCAYRIFDSRPCYFSSVATDRPRRELIDNVVGKENLCLLSSRQQANPGYRHCWVVDAPANDCVISTTSREANQVFILYIYPDQKNPQKTVLPEHRKVNFSSDFIKSVSLKIGFQPQPEKIFYYIYAILSSPNYRLRYADFLKVDFPRIPLTRHRKLFEVLAMYGQELADLHLLKAKSLVNLSTNFEQNGTSLVASSYPKYKDGKVIINKQGDGFAGVPEEVWNFYIGGYQVCHKWLKDRKGRTLSDEDIIHYQKIIVAIQETITLMQKIDEAIPSWPIE